MLWPAGGRITPIQLMEWSTLIQYIMLISINYIQQYIYLKLLVVRATMSDFYAASYKKDQRQFQELIAWSEAKQ